MAGSPRVKRILLIAIIASGGVLYLCMGFGMAGGWVAVLAPVIEITAVVSAIVLGVAVVLFALASRRS